MKKRDLLKRIETLDRQLDAIATRQQEQIDELREAVGGFWRMKNGTKRALIALSTEHLRNIVNVMRPGYPLEGQIKEELVRRKLDLLYRSYDKAKTKKVRDACARMIEALGGMAPIVQPKFHGAPRRSFNKKGYPSL